MNNFMKSKAYLFVIATMTVLASLIVNSYGEFPMESVLLTYDLILACGLLSQWSNPFANEARWRIVSFQFVMTLLFVGIDTVVPVAQPDLVLNGIQLIPLIAKVSVGLFERPLVDSTEGLPLAELLILYIVLVSCQLSCRSEFLQADRRVLTILVLLSCCFAMLIFSAQNRILRLVGYSLAGSLSVALIMPYSSSTATVAAYLCLQAIIAIYIRLLTRQAKIDLVEDIYQSPKVFWLFVLSLVVSNGVLNFQIWRLWLKSGTTLTAVFSISFCSLVFLQAFLFLNRNFQAGKIVGQSFSHAEN